MNAVIFKGTTYEAEKIVKASDSVIGYTQGVEVFSFHGISDFSQFEFLGEWERPFQEPPDLSYVMFELIKRELEVLELRNVVSFLGQESINREIETADLKMQTRHLGSMTAGLEVKLLANEKGGSDIV